MLEDSLHIHYNTDTGRINSHKKYGISRYDALKTPENRDKLLSAIRECGYKKVMPRFNKIVDRRKQVYEDTGWKYAEEFLELQRDRGGKFYFILMEFGEKPLYSKKTRETAVKAIKKLVGDLPAYWKIERMDSEQSKIHAHILMLIPDGHSFPKRVNNFIVKPPIRLGSKAKYRGIPMHQQVRNTLCYLFKPADARAGGRYYKEMYFEWWQNEINKVTGGKVWERPSLRGALNLEIGWLDGYSREEMESRYEESPYKYHSTPDQLPNNPRPVEENSTPTHTNPETPEHFGCKDEILARRPLGGYGSGGVFAVVSELSRDSSDAPYAHKKSPEIREKPPDNRGKLVEYH